MDRPVSASAGPEERDLERAHAEALYKDSIYLEQCTPMGRPPRLVRGAYEHEPIESAPLLPKGIRGLYVLYDPEGFPIKVGISGRGRRQTVFERFRDDYYRYTYWRNVASFSVYTFEVETMYKQVETLILRAVGKALPGNDNAGHLPKGTARHRLARRSYPHYFLQRRVDSEGRVNLGARNSRRRVRVELGPRLER